MDMLREEARLLPVVRDFDVIVSGGGPAGVAAAISAARNGAKTCLMELKGCLGGTWTAGLLAWIIDHHNKSGIMRELIEELRARHASAHISPNSSFPFDVEEMKLLLEEKCLEAGVYIRLHTRVAAAAVDGRRITHVITESKSGREAWSARSFIDATGDGDLAAAAGCGFDFADPETGLTQPMSLLAIISGLRLEEVIDVTNGYGEWGSSKQKLLEEFRSAGVEPSYAFPSLFHIVDDVFFLMANHQYKVSAINADDVSAATVRARAEVMAQVKALRSLGGRWKNIRTIATAEQIGTREGRRVKGRYTITVDDITAGAEFPDAVCKCNFCIDVHAPDPDKCKGIVPQKLKAKPYDIPLRALVSADYDNLLMAGRCISGDFLAHSSYRVTGDVVPMGEAAGKAAAMAAAAGGVVK